MGKNCCCSCLQSTAGELGHDQLTVVTPGSTAPAAAAMWARDEIGVNQDDHEQRSWVGHFQQVHQQIIFNHHLTMMPSPALTAFHLVYRIFDILIKPLKICKVAKINIADMITESVYESWEDWRDHFKVLRISDWPHSLASLWQLSISCLDLTML